MYTEGSSVVVDACVVLTGGIRDNMTSSYRTVHKKCSAVL